MRVRPTGHVPPANAAKQVGRKYVWRHLPLRGSRGQHFTVFQSQPPGRQPFGLKVKSPHLPTAGRPPSRRGGLGRQAPSPPRGPKGSLEPAGWPPLARKSFQPSAFRILSPFSALVVYSESGAQPSAIQTLLSRTRLRAPARPGCRAPREV